MDMPHQVNHVTGLNSQAKALIECFESGPRKNLANSLFASTYHSLDDILRSKYHLSETVDIFNLVKKYSIPGAVTGDQDKS